MRTGDRSGVVKAELLLLLVVLIWASNYPIAKFSIRQLDPLVFNAVRYAIASLLLLTVFRATGAAWVPVGAGDRVQLLRAGVVAGILYQIAFIFGLKLTTAGNSAVLMATAPLWTVAISARMHHEPIARRVWAGMGLSLAGVVLIIVGSGRRMSVGGVELYGDLISIAAAVLWAFNTNLQKPLLGTYSPLQLSMMMITIGAVGLTLTAVPAAAVTDWSSIEWPAWAGAIASGALSIAVANLIWSTGVKRLGPGRTGSFGNLIPVVALAVSAVTLGESFAPIQIAGAALTIFGVWYARR
jgi:drug/metabolite transporter (DMT)-like permease